MKKLACKDVSGLECDFVAEAETNEEVKAALTEHGASAHGEAMEAMTPEQKEEMAKKSDELLASQE